MSLSPPLMYPGRYQNEVPGNRWMFNNPNASFKSRILRWIFTTIFRKKDDSYIRYECLGVHVVFQDIDWYVPVGNFEPYLNHVISRYVGAVPGKDPFDLMVGYSLVFTRDRPFDILHGHTWPSKKMSHVYSPYIFGGDADGWELSLGMQHLIFGDHNEGWDKKKMIELGIFSRLADYPGSKDQVAWREGVYLS